MNRRKYRLISKGAYLAVALSGTLACNEIVKDIRADRTATHNYYLTARELEETNYYLNSTFTLDSFGKINIPKEIERRQDLIKKRTSLEKKLNEIENSTELSKERREATLHALKFTGYFVGSLISLAYGSLISCALKLKPYSSEKPSQTISSPSNSKETKYRR